MSQAYRYHAARADGKVLVGRIEAQTAAQAGALLIERGLEPVRMEAADPDSTAIRPAPKRELAIAFRSIAALTAAGVPLERAMAATEGLIRGRLQECLAAARIRLHDGHTLAAALDAERGTVPPVVIGMVRAGELAGRLDTALDQIALHLEREAELLSRIRQALAYPALLATAGVGSAVVIGAVVVPKFAVLLGDMGQELPPASRLLLAGSAVLTRHWLALVVFLVALTSLTTGWIRQPGGRLQWDRMLLGLPGIGPVRHGLAMVRVCQALGAGLGVGLPLLPALETAREAAGDLAIAGRLSAARERVARGEALSTSLGRERVLAGGALQLAAVGESSGQLGVMLTRAGDLAAQETERALGAIVTLIEPLLVILLGGFIAFVAAALLQAVYSLRPTG
jgi:general secretion pathway protein F